MESLPEHFGRFRVLAELGRGAMGVVYRAEDATLGRVVAIKTISLAGATGPERDQAEARFLQEARAAARVSHPAIVTIYETGREGDTEFIAMELIEGKDLRELIRSGSLEPSQSLAIAAAAAEGLASAHEQGVVHRDVKPGNIMGLADGRVKIMDFGIARLREPAVKTQTGLLLGSPQYMAPEQIVGRPFDHRADIFSLGLVLYEMLTGTKAFAGEDLAELTFKLANVAAPPPSRFARGLPPVVDLIVARALRKKAEDRYATAAEFARDLRAALGEGGDEAQVDLDPTSATTLPMGRPAQRADGAAADESLALHASPRFDSREGLARLTVIAPEATGAHSGTRPPPALRRRRVRVDPRGLALAAAYVLAAIAAVFIAIG